MKHMDREEALIQGLLRSSRTIAVIGASPRPDRHSREVVRYLHQHGYDVVPVRPDRAPVNGLPTFGSLEDLGGVVDLAVIFRRPDAVSPHVAEAAARRVRAIWLPPGVWTKAAEQEAERHGLTLIKDRCVIEAHKHHAGALGEPGAGHPTRTGVHMRRRARGVDVATGGSGYAAGGGGGTRGGGGVRAALDEKKMRRGRRRRKAG